jgi:hypothetical protein
MRDHDVVEVPCDGTGSAVDVDTPEDLRQLNDQPDQPKQPQPTEPIEQTESTESTE